jgi:hypothetical protein
MTFSAEIGLPAILYIHGMLKLNEAVDRCILHFAGGALCDDGMAQVTVFRDYLPVITDMPVGVTPEAAIGFKMSDVVKVLVRGGPHIREDIEGKFLKNPGNSFVNRGFP